MNTGRAISRLFVKSGLGQSWMQRNFDENRLPSVAVLFWLLLPGLLAGGAGGLKNMGNRLEGIQLRLEEAANYQVRGFVVPVDETGPFNAATSLHIAYFSPDDHPLFGDAQEIYDNNHYHMQPLRLRSVPNSWAEFSGWPARDFLLPLSIARDQLTVVIRRDTRDIDATEFIPAILFENRRPAVVERYSLYWATQRALTSLTYELVGQNGFHTRTEYKGPDGSGAVEQDATHLLSFDVSHLPQGWCFIRLYGRYPNNFDELRAEYRFYHKPDVN
ncbi:MAG TPA: hypothetical protein VHU83_16890 [Bryobacteraceae bacterium]|jgi:hypothetical protein|nr:hypothetical protein [Bryobacteraceae bacterium]